MTGISSVPISAHVYELISCSKQSYMYVHIDVDMRALALYMYIMQGCAYVHM